MPIHVHEARPRVCIFWPVARTKGKKLDGRFVVCKKLHDDIGYLLIAELMSVDDVVICLLLLLILCLKQRIGNTEIAEVAQLGER